MKILNVVESAYRGTLEEQDDTILWLSRALEKSGAQLTVLLRGNAVNYAVTQACPPLAIGGAKIAHPAQPNEDLLYLRSRGTRVLAVQEDLDERGIDKGRCLDSVERIPRAEVVELLESHDQIWHW
jgi:sulfur relay (sulfurtransferase) DsrF/TusC family protein